MKSEADASRNSLRRRRFAASPVQPAGTPAHPVWGFAVNSYRPQR